MGEQIPLIQLTNAGRVALREELETCIRAMERIDQALSDEKKSYKDWLEGQDEFKAFKAFKEENNEDREPFLRRVRAILVELGEPAT
jgi:hypothetical protein